MLFKFIYTYIYIYVKIEKNMTLQMLWQSGTIVSCNDIVGPAVTACQNMITDIDILSFR